ncbi:6-phospho-3-hexuloisomerase [Bacillus sp. L381]|uniref:6-phospho-3-hexuloisomerase n=1 Tax=Bacillus TaxID=1386 RepID=UPI001BA6C928|nr:MULTISPECIES: 6-phospho-3-hexuloisomerase [Bacillus]MCR9040530.1 6-phospho-3-hexuloisomerase [Bacillus velezensis]QUN09946.1 6-phospho-3-hexuloisomerase [Bacillus amyloliquefaciens]QYM83022.1 6-phospho-3-hexuloisomerase [Bacillus sp. 7D3]QZY12260.1 6-phospho-3-hexuloisomerase [Bacillus amyloliquefaciens]WIX22077.1 6-phospho-3-hexuloisomerase [Bacillus sp. L381]
MKTTEYLHDILNELSRTSSLIADSEADKLAEQILSADQIFTSGAGRSGFIAKAFAMRMMHIGLNAYIVGETLTPPLQEGGLVIIGSGSGETKSLLHTAEKAKSLHGIIAALTINPDSSLGKLADLTITIPGSPKEETDGDRKTIQPMGSLFEQTLLLFYDAVILKIMEKKELNSADMFTKHANLE